MSCDKLTETNPTYDFYTQAQSYLTKTGSAWNDGGGGALYTDGFADTTYSGDPSITFDRLAGSVFLDMYSRPNNAYFDVYYKRPTDGGFSYANRIQCNAPGSAMQHSLCILSGEQNPQNTIIKIALRKGAVSMLGLGFKMATVNRNRQG